MKTVPMIVDGTESAQPGQELEAKTGDFAPTDFDTVRMLSERKRTLDAFTVISVVSTVVPVALSVMLVVQEGASFLLDPKTWIMLAGGPLIFTIVNHVGKKYSKIIAQVLDSNADRIRGWLKSEINAEVTEQTAKEIVSDMTASKVPTHKHFTTVDGKKYERTFHNDLSFSFSEIKSLRPSNFEAVSQTLKEMRDYKKVGAEDMELVKEIESKVDSLSKLEVSEETRATLTSVAQEAVKAVKLQTKIATLDSNAETSLRPILQLLNSELEAALGKEAAELKREMEVQKAYVQSRQVDEKSKYNLNPEN